MAVGVLGCWGCGTACFSRGLCPQGSELDRTDEAWRLRESSTFPFTFFSPCFSHSAQVGMKTYSLGFPPLPGAVFISAPTKHKLKRSSFAYDSGKFLSSLAKESSKWPGHPHQGVPRQLESHAAHPAANAEDLFVPTDIFH